MTAGAPPACRNCLSWQQRSPAQKRHQVGECYAGMPTVCHHHQQDGGDSICPKAVLTEADYVCANWQPKSEQTTPGKTAASTAA